MLTRVAISDHRKMQAKEQAKKQKEMNEGTFSKKSVKGVELKEFDQKERKMDKYEAAMVRNTDLFSSYPPRKLIHALVLAA